MANSLLTPTQVTREALVVLHQKLNFVNRVNRQYDDQYAREGAKIGNSLKIRLPNQYEVTDGRVMTGQDTVETSVTLTISNQKHVGMNFTNEDLTLSLDDFSERIIRPAMAVLAARIESDVITNLYKKVYNQVNNVGSGATFNLVSQARKKLVDNLTPDDKLNFHMATQTNVDLMDSLKGLFNPQGVIGEQYVDGYVAKGQGFTFFENTHMPRHVSGTDANGYQINGANQSGPALTIDTGTGTFAAGDVVTFQGVFDVHPETKVSRATLKQFVVTAATGASATSLSISPAIVTTGASKNVSNAPADDAPITKVGGTGAAYDVNLAFHRDAFAFVTADLFLPKGADWATREVMDGISMRIWRDGDIVNDQMRTRVDVLYGFEAIRPQIATRLATN